MDENKKILDLSDVSDDCFEQITTAVNKWKDAGVSGMFTFLTRDEVEKDIRRLQEQLAFESALPHKIENAFVKGVVAGGACLVAGMIAGWILDKVTEDKSEK